VPAGIERMAAADAPDAFGYSNDHSILLDRADEVCAACRMESAFWPEQRADEFLVEAHQPNQNVARQLNDLFENG